MDDKIQKVLLDYYKLLAQAKGGTTAEDELRNFVETARVALLTLVKKKSDDAKELQGKKDPDLAKEAHRIARIAERMRDNLPPGIPVKWSFCLAGFVIIVALGLVIYLTAFLKNPSPFQNKLILALVCFILSSSSALLFAVRAKIEGTLGVLTVTLGGPGVLWIASLLIFEHFTDTKIEAQLPRLVRDLLRQADQREGWIPYSEWNTKIGNFRQLFESDEETFVSADLLPGVFYSGVEDSKKLSNPIIDTLFFYNTNVTVKLQHIHGSRVSRNQKPSVYLAATPSTAAGKVVTFAFTREDNEINPIETLQHSGWLPVDDVEADVFVVTFYYSDEISSGDWICLDIPRYAGAGDAADTSLGLCFAGRTFKNATYWEMKADADSTTSPAPLTFRQLDRLTVQTNLNLLCFAEWFQAFDRDSRFGKHVATPGEGQAAPQVSMATFWPSLTEALTGNRTNSLQLQSFFGSTNIMSAFDSRWVPHVKVRNSFLVLFHVN